MRQLGPMRLPIPRTRRGRGRTLRGLALLLPVLAMACTVGPYRPVGPVPISRALVHTFTPLVQPSGDPSECEVPVASEEISGGRSVAAVSEDGARSVAVVVAEDGSPIRYSDARHGRSDVGGRNGDRTTIVAYIAEGYVVAANWPSEGQPFVMEVPLEDALGAATLGYPENVLRGVLERCGS